MVKKEHHNAIGDRNATITPRPTILFKSDSPDRVRAELFREVFGSKLVRDREFTAEYLVPGTPEHRAMEAGTTEGDRATLKAISLLRYAHADTGINAQALRDAAQILLPGHPAREAMIKPELFGSLLTRGMAGAKLVMRPTKHGDFVPMILCSNLRCAAFVASAYRRISVCANCHELFALDAVRADGSATEKYCTAACGQRYRQRMYRLRSTKSQKSKSGRRS